MAIEAVGDFEEQYELFAPDGRRFYYSPTDNCFPTEAMAAAEAQLISEEYRETVVVRRVVSTAVRIFRANTTVEEVQQS